MIFNDEKYSLKKTISLLLIIMVIGAIFGFVYETIFYRIDLGYFVKRGSTYGPWIPIYAFGSLFITVLTYRFKKKPLLVFFLNILITGILEYLSGYVLYTFFNTRLWDYNVEIWNFGNINGFICLRSVLFFGISSLLLIYGIIPFIKKITKKISDKKLFIFSIIIGGIFFVDMFIYAILN